MPTEKNAPALTGLHPQFPPENPINGAPLQEFRTGSVISYEDGSQYVYDAATEKWNWILSEAGKEPAPAVEPSHVANPARIAELEHAVYSTLKWGLLEHAKDGSVIIVQDTLLQLLSSDVAKMLETGKVPG